MKKRFYAFMSKIFMKIERFGEKYHDIFSRKYGLCIEKELRIKPIPDMPDEVDFPPAITKGGCEVQTGCFQRADCHNWRLGQ